MLNFKPLELSDRDILDKYLVPYRFNTCEYSFINLFIWRRGCDIQYAIKDDVLIIKKIDFDGSYHFMQPINYTKENLKDIVKLLLEEKERMELDFLFKDAEEEFMKELIEIYGDKVEYEEDRDNFDYIYDSEKLMTLSGKSLHGQKNHYNYFVKNNQFYVKEFDSDTIKQAMMAAREWCHKNECKGYLLYELRAIEELLKNKDKLDYKGIAVYVNDKVAAFTIGEKVTDDMAVIHIEKADTEIRGLYAYINRTFVQNYFSDVKYINREQDLGIEGLRKAKTGYNPVKLEKKYSVKNILA